MANSKRSISKSCRISVKKSYRTNRRIFNSFLRLLQTWQDIEFCHDLPILQNLLTRSQRLRVADLAEATGVHQEVWVRRAIENFLEGEGWVRTQSAKRRARR